MPFLNHHNLKPLPKSRKRKEKEVQLPRLDTSNTSTTTAFSSKEFVTAIEIANMGSAADSNRISRILSSAARLGRRASVILPGVGGAGRKGSMEEGVEEGVEEVGEKDKSEEGVAKDDGESDEENEESVEKVEVEVEVEAAASTSTASSSRPTTASASASPSPTTATSPLTLHSKTSSLSQPSSIELPQRCFYNPAKDEYIPEQTPTARHPTTSIFTSTSTSSFAPILTSSPTSQTPTQTQPHAQTPLEITSLMTPINTELRNLAETSLARAEERKLRFQRRRTLQRQDLSLQIAETEAQNEVLKRELLKSGEGSDDDDEKSIYSQISRFNDSEEDEKVELEEERAKRLEHRDSGISMGDNATTSNHDGDKENDQQQQEDQQERKTRAQEHWNSIRAYMRSPHNDTDNDSDADNELSPSSSSETQHPKPFVPSRSRARRWSLRMRWETTLGHKLNDAQNDGLGEWRHILWISPSLEKQVSERQNEERSKKEKEIVRDRRPIPCDKEERKQRIMDVQDYGCLWAREGRRGSKVDVV